MPSRSPILGSQPVRALGPEVIPVHRGQGGLEDQEPRLANDPASRQWARRGAAASASPTSARKMMALPGNPVTDRMAARIEWPTLAQAVLQKERLHPITWLPDQPRRRPTGSRFDPQSIS